MHVHVLVRADQQARNVRRRDRERGRFLWDHAATYVVYMVCSSVVYVYVLLLHAVQCLLQTKKTARHSSSRRACVHPL